MTFFPHLSGPSCFSRLISTWITLEGAHTSSIMCMHTCVHVCKHSHTHSQSHFTLQQQRTIHTFQEHCLCIFINGFFLLESPVYTTSLFYHHHSNSYSSVRSHSHSLEVFPDLPSPGIVTFPPSVFWDAEQLPKDRLQQWMVNNSIRCIQDDHQFPNISFLLDRKLPKNWDLMLVSVFLVCTTGPSKQRVLKRRVTQLPSPKKLEIYSTCSLFCQLYSIIMIFFFFAYL